MRKILLEHCFIEIRNGANIKQGVLDGGYPITRIETLSNGQFNRDRMGYAGILDHEKYSGYVLDDEDLLMSHINSVQYLGRTVLYKKDEDEIIIHGMNLLRLKAKKDIVYPAYIKYYFSGRKFKDSISKITKKSVNQASFAVTDLKNITLQIPIINDQISISEKLAKIESIIKLRNEELKMLDELIKSRFVEMFGEPVTNPKGWGKYKLKDVCKINPKKSDDSRLVNDLEVSFVAMPSVSEKGDLDTCIIKLYNEVRNGFTYFAENDVLFAKITPCMENGKGAIAVGLKNGVGFGSTEFHVLRPIINKANPYWIYYLTMFDTFRDEAKRKMTGSAGQRRVPSAFLECYEVGVPPIDHQNKFATFVHKVDKLKFDRIILQFFSNIRTVYVMY